IGFSPVLPTKAEGNTTTQAQYLPFPGHHATLVGNPFWRNGKLPDNRDLINLPQPGIVIRWLLEQFLLEHGSKLGEQALLKLDRHEVLAHFTTMLANQDQ